MGLTSVRLKVKPLAGKHFEEVDFLVDSGAFLSVLPEKVWRKLKITKKDRLHFSLADGQVIERDIGYAMVSMGDLEGPCKVVLGQKDDEALLGATALEALGLVLDPIQRKLYPARMML